MTDADPQALLGLAIELATQAGALLLAGIDKARTAVTTKSSITDMVSEMDRAAESLIVTRLATERPDDAILAEEGGAATGSSGLRWVIDPLDGTTNYLYGIPAWSVSIAVEQDGATIAGAVRDPSRGDTFSAIAGHGSFRNGVRLSPRPVPTLDRALIGTGFGYSSTRRAAQAALLPTVLPEVRDIRRFGSAALDLCWVGAGEMDGYYEAGLAPWDLAAGSLVATEAGIWVGTIDPAQMDPSKIRPASIELPEIVVAAPAGLAEPLIELIRRALAS
ncbi:MAG: inositol monophosphatase family protein [Acidimicrobiales bacterium]